MEMYQYGMFKSSHQRHESYLRQHWPPVVEEMTPKPRSVDASMRMGT